MDTRVLERIGLSKGEVKVYLALLQLGQSTAGPIVDESQVTRSKIYDILERLKRKGLVSSIIKESTKYFSAANPSTLLEYLEKREGEIKREKESIRNILPKLLFQHAVAKEKNIAEVFIGMTGMENAFSVLVDEFDSQEPYYAFGAGKGEDIRRIQYFFSRLHQKRVKMKVRSFIIFNESSRGLFKSQEKSKLIKSRYLNQSTPAAINIYKNYTIITILTKEPVTLLLRNKEVADSFREYFSIMWKTAKS